MAPKPESMGDFDSAQHESPSATKPMHVETVPDTKFLRHSSEAHFSGSRSSGSPEPLTANCPANLFSRNILLTRYRKTINNGVNARWATGIERSVRTFALCSLRFACWGRTITLLRSLRMRETRTLNIELLNLEPFLEFLELALPPAVGYTLCQRKK